MTILSHNITAPHAALRDWLLPLLMNGQVTVVGEVESLEKKGVVWVKETFL